MEKESIYKDVYKAIGDYERMAERTFVERLKRNLSKDQLIRLLMESFDLVESERESKRAHRDELNRLRQQGDKNFERLKEKVEVLRMEVNRWYALAVAACKCISGGTSLDIRLSNLSTSMKGSGIRMSELESTKEETP